MSVAVSTARPSQALRQRRESQRPVLGRTSTAKAIANTENLDNMENGAAHGNDRPYVRTQPYILKKYSGCPPSFRVALHPTHFRINGSQDSLSYKSPMNELLKHIREKTVPHNMLEEIYLKDIPFYEGAYTFVTLNYVTSSTNNTQQTASS